MSAPRRPRLWWRLSVRRRVVLALLLSWPIAYFYIGWTWTNLFYVALAFRRYGAPGPAVCNADWRTYATTCLADSPGVVLAEVLVVAAIFLTLVVLLVRAVLAPVAAMAETVERLGPTSLGLRLQREGPRDETQRLADAIDVLLDRVAEGYEAQRRFASTASHELRTPLATQRALIEVSLGSALTSEQLDLVSRQLLATNERNERLIDGLLTLAETDRGLMARQPQRLDEIAAQACELYADDDTVKITTDLSAATVAGELPLLERLVANLVGNAIKYNEPGGWVSVTVAPDGAAAARLTVANTGPVVRADQVGGLFEPFRRLSGERLDHTGGVGLGLTIARSIVAAHGGRISAVPREGGGLVMTVSLPAARQPAARQPAARPLRG